MTETETVQTSLPAIMAMGLTEHCAGSSTLATLKSLPPALTDEQFTKVKALAKSGPPPLPGMGDKAFAEAMTMLAATLPRRKADDDFGEVHVRVYRRCLSHLSAPQMWWTVEQAIKRSKFYPSVKELLDIAEGWVRRDEDTEAHRLARHIATREANRRHVASMRKPAPPLTQAAIDAMDPAMISMGLKCGALIERDGRVIANPEPIADR